MNFAAPFIKRPVLTTLVMVTFIVFGMMAYNKLPVSSIPSIEYPTIQVTVNYPGAGPEEMARLISSPLERQFILMEGIKMVSATNTYQSTTIILMFHLDVDINVGAQETEQAIQKAMAQLPKNLPQNPVYTKVNPSDTPILYIVIHSQTIPSWNLYEYGYNYIGQQIGTVNGVANINTFGYPYAVRVKVDPEACAAKNITLKEVANAIDNANPISPTGKFYGKYTSMVTEVDGQIMEAEGYNSLIIKYQEDTPVRLSDIGYAYNSMQNDKQVFTWLTKETPQGEQAAVIAVYRSLGHNTVQVCKDVLGLVNRLRKELPHGMSMSIPFTLETWILEAVADVKFTLLVAFILVIIVIYFYLGRIRNSLIPLLTLPITVIGTFIFMYLLGFSIDILSLSAITLSIGFLIDDTIVVLENIIRWMQQDEKNPYLASFKGSKQIVITVVSTSLCLGIVFIPMLFMQGAVGQIFHEFAAVILIAILFSSFISLSLTPMLCSRFLKSYATGQQKPMEKFSSWLNVNMLKAYRPALLWSMRHKVWILMGGCVSIILSLLLLFSMPREFLPEEDLGLIQGFAISKEGTSPERMTKYMEEITSVLTKSPYIATTAKLQSTPTDNQSLFFISLVPREERPDIWQCMGELNKEIRHQVLGVNFAMKAFPLINLQVGDVQAGKATNQFLLQGFDETLLYASAPAFIDKLMESPFLMNVNSNFQPNSPVLKVHLLRDQAYSYGDINAREIENNFGYAYGETYISKINALQNMYYVILETTPRFDRGPGQLNNLYLDQVAMKSLINTEIVTRPETVNHINTLPSAMVVFDPAPGVPLSKAVAAVQKIADETLPTGVLGAFAGNTAEFQKSGLQFIELIFIAIFGVYIVLGILYENFLHPITPLSGVPVAALGGLLTLAIFGKVLSIYALIGLIMLLGIVMKNGILVVDFALEELEKEDQDLEQAVIKACEERFRPIIMTTLSTAVGALPIALGIGGAIAKGRAPLGLAVVGGLIFSQAVTLFLTPCVFCYVHRLHIWFTKQFTLFQHRAE